MDFFAISGLLNGIAAISLAALVYSRSPRDPRHWSYGLLGLSIAVWSFGYFFWQIADSSDQALFLCRFLMAGAIFIPVTQLHHVLYLTNEANRLGTVLTSTYFIGGFFLLVDATPYFISHVQPTDYFPFWPQPGPVFHFFLLWWVAVAFYACYLLALAHLRGKGLRKKQFLYLLVASGLAYVGGATNFPLWYGIELLPYGTICFTFYVALVAYTLLRYHLMDFSVFVEKGLSYLAVLLLISQPAYPVLLLAQKSLLGTISYRFSMVQLFVHLLTVAGAYQMRLGTRQAIARSVMKGQDSSLRTLSQFSTNISTLQDMKLLGKEIIGAMSRGMRAQTAMLFVLNKDHSKYIQVSDYGSSVHSPANLSFAVTEDLPRYLAIVKSRIVCKELKHSFPDQWKETVFKDLKNLNADVCFPFIRKNRLLGFCLLSPCLPESLDAAESIGFIPTLVREASLALENAILREEVIRSQTIMRHMDRLRSLETMSAGLAQELTSPQSSIKAFVQLAQLRKNDEEFLKRFKAVVSSDVSRIEQLTKEIREYVTDESTNGHSYENINELIESCVSFVSKNPEFQHIKIEPKLDPEIPKILFRRQEMRHVVFNLLLFHLSRAYDNGKYLFIKTQGLTSSTGDRWIQVEISDKQEQHSLDLLPIPLYSQGDYLAKLESTDLADQGMSIAKEIVNAYGGFIQVYGSKAKSLKCVLSLPRNENAEFGTCEERFQAGSLDLQNLTPPIHDQQR